MTTQRRSGARRSGLTAACGLLALGSFSASALAQSAPNGAGRTVSLDVAGSDLHTVVNMLEHRTGIEALVRDGDTPFRLVNVHLNDADLGKALRTIAFSAGARVSVNPDGIYVFEPESRSGDNSQAPAPQPVQYADSGDTPRHYAPGELQYRSIVLQHAVPTDILKLMHWDKDVVDMDPFRPVQMPQSHPAVLTVGQSNAQTVYGGSQYSPQPYYNAPQQQNYPQQDYSTGGGYPSVPMGTGNAGPNAASYSQHRSADPEQANQFPGGGGFGGGGFGGGGNGFGGGGGASPFAPQPFQPGAGVRGNTQAQLPDGVTKIFALQSNNSLLVYGTVEGYNQVKQVVKILDIKPRQVQIKVEFVTASVADVDNLGINFDLVPFPGIELASKQGDSTIVSNVAPTFLQYATGNVVAQLFQTLTRSRGKVVQAPLITTTNNVTASIEVNTQIPFFTTTVVNTGGNNNGTATGQQANFLQLQTGLTVTPRINSDDSVTLNLAPQITDTTGQSPVGGIPPTITQRVTTLRTVRSGDTMVLGGLVRKQETSSTQRIPILADLPILGNLFRTRSKQTNDQELLIFVTPTIIGESNDSATANANGGQSVTVTP